MTTTQVTYGKIADGKTYTVRMLAGQRVRYTKLQVYAATEAEAKQIAETWAAKLGVPCTTV